MMNDVQTQALLRSRARDLLAGGEVSCVIGWENTRAAGKTRVFFARTAADAQRLVWNADCTVSTAKHLLHACTQEGKIALCARGCDTRAVNRMIADGQLSRSAVYILGLPCTRRGTPACERCRHRNPVVYDELIGDTVPEAAEAGRFSRIEEAERLPAAQRREFWRAQFQKCIRCYACRNVCPCCSCRECYLDQHRTGWQGKQLCESESRIYGLTRAFHVGDRCIECGECERVCPVGIPIMLQTGKMLRDINSLYGECECGLSPDETPALGKYGLGDADDFV